MKQTFSGYYKDRDLAEVLRENDSIIVLDSSILCNLYGFHDEVWKPILDMLYKKRDSLWLPYNMAAKYHRGIVDILVNKIQLLVSLKNRLQQTTDLLRNLPFSFPERSDYENLSLRISNKLTLEIANIKQRGKKDSEIREAISQLFYKRVGALNNDPDPMSFRISSYNEVTEADALSGRNSSEMPVNTAISEEQQISNPNDIILHTLIKLSKDKNKDVLYVISEPSEYWSVFIGKTSFGPNPEHQSYFNRNTNGHNFYCCTFASFMQKLAVSLEETMSDEIRHSLMKLSYGAMRQNDEGNII